MENQENTIDTSSDQFGMSQEDIKNYQIKSFWGRIKYYFSQIEPALVKILSSIVYYTLKFIKAFVKSAFKMILGKDV